MHNTRTSTSTSANELTFFSSCACAYAYVQFAIVRHLVLLNCEGLGVVLFALWVSSLYARAFAYAVLKLIKRFAVFTDAKSIKVLKVRLSQSSGWNKLLTSVAYRARNTSVQAILHLHRFHYR